MRALPVDQRTLNYTGKDHCGVCDDNGWVPYLYRVDTHNGRSASIEEMAPCPFCERGFRQEFPKPPEDREKRRAWIEPPWGWTDGYWKGQELPDDLIQARIDADKRKPPLSQREQLAAIQTLAGMVVRTMPDEAIPAEPEVEERERPPERVAADERWWEAEQTGKSTERGAA